MDCLGLHCPLIQEERMDRFNEREKDIKKELITVQLERAATRECVHRHKVLIAPERWLPVELLSEVFHFGLADTDIQDRLALGQVCKRWRHALDCTPVLWTHVDLAKTPIPFLVNVWLPRLRSAPLTLTGDFSHRPRVETQRALEVITSVSTQWADVDLTLYVSNMCTLEAAKGRLPTLRSLRLEVGPVTQGIVWHTFESAPLLRRFKIPLCAWITFCIPWNQIEEVMCQSWNFDMHNELLRQSPRLLAYTSFVWAAPWADRLWEIHNSPTTVTNEPITHCLEHLNVTCFDPVYPDIGTVMTPVFPRLKFLSLTGFTWNRTSWSSFLLRSKCITSVLVLSDLRIDSKGLLEVLSSMPSIGVLHLEELACLSPGTDIFRRLTYHLPSDATRPPHILPNLHSCVLCMKTAPMDVDALIAMVESRLDGDDEDGEGEDDTDDEDEDISDTASAASLVYLDSLEIQCRDRAKLLARCEAWRDRGLDFELDNS